MRKLIEDSEYTQLRAECKVFSRREVGDGVEIAYESSDGSTQWVRGSYLVGADGKRGVVRKEFLEPLGIKQEVGM
jgi:2-polyprenyl-6-methoxyphenol hydroxylase-like FAD-dependent oxidoreductase